MTTRDAPCILLVEDDAETREAVSQILSGEGYRVIAVERGEAGTRALEAGDVVAVVLDVMLPDTSGIDLCRAWRASGVGVPVLMLTARTDVASRVRGLDAGADDYLGKPFALSELRARLRALLRRGSDPLRTRVLTCGEVRVDFGRRQAWLGDSEVPLTRRELDVLERIAWGRGHAVSRDDLMEEIWGESSPEATASLDVMIARLRRKLETGGKESLIRTVRGFGYALAAGREKTP
ncbi:MAG TPA: response regulator transcription factor [Patescibacteria group bacterium]|nr:response regulator transcription factor [Patescibacteria group bacterium]